MKKNNNDLQKKNYVHYLRLIILTNMKKSCEKRVMKVTLVLTNIEINFY